MAAEDKFRSEPSEKQLAKGEDDEPAQTIEREAGWGDYFRVFTYAKRWDSLLMAAAAIAAIGAGVTMPLMNVIFGRLVNGFTSFGASADSRAQLESTINRQCLFIFILFLARLALNYVSKLTLRLIGIRISAAIRMHYLESLLNQTVHVLDSMESGAAAGTITSTANTLQIGISEKLGTGVEASSTFITAIVVAFYYSWRIALVTLCAIFFILLVVAIVLPFILKGTAKHTKAETTAGAVATEAFSAIRMIYACGAQERMANRYARFVIEAENHGLKTSPLLGTQFGLVFFGMYSAFALCFWYGTRAYADGQVNGSIGTIVVVLMNVFLMAMSLERISTPLIAISKAIVAAATFFTVIDAPKPDRGHLKDPDVAADGNITFEGVTFAYPGRPSTKVLDDLHLTVEAGKILAIVGPSGSGKSTIVGLIEKWYSLHDQPVIVKAIAKDKAKKRKKDDNAELDQSAKKSFWARMKPRVPHKSDVDEEDNELDAAGNEKNSGPPVQLAGRIVSSGHNLDEIDVKWWRSQIGLVQQEPFLFNDSIYNNVMHGLVGTQWEHEPLSVKQKLAEEACQEAFAAEFIEKLPDGYETAVGDAGLKLSGGQRQRLAIARSIIKKPKILILDEATSAIDVRSEKIIQAALDRVSKGRTTIMIAHRLSTISKADKIAVLSKGKLVEQGTHEDLLKNEAGIYSGLVRAQHLTLGKEVHGDDSEEPEESAEEEVQPALSREKSAGRVTEGLDETAVESSWKDKGLIGSFGRLLWEQRSRFPSYVIIAIFAAVIGAGTPFTAYLFGQVISVFELPVGNEFLNRAAFWSLMWLVFAICTGIGYFVNGFVATSLQFFICAVYRQQYFKALIRQPITFFDAEDNSVGTLTARVQGDPKQLEELLGMNMAFVVASVFQLTGGLIIAFYFNWKLALLGTCVTVPIGLTCAYYRFKHERQFEKMSAAVFAESSKWAAEAIGAFRCVSSLTLEDEINKRYQVLLRGHVLDAYKKARWSTIIFALSDSMSLACNALIFWFGGHQLARGELDVLAFFVCYMAVQQGADAAGVGFSFGPNAAQANAAANRILSVRESRGEHNPRDKGTSSDMEESEKSSGVVPDSEGGVRIDLRDVGFKYPTRDVSIFRHLNITVEKGQFAALVGASGAGKSSIVGLLERFYDVQSGSISCNGKNIKDVDVYEYRKLLSLVAQEATLFQGTIKENILLGVPDDNEAVTDAQLHQACQDAAIHDFIVSLPEGYNTNVGSRGVALSGGQKQRIAIARAIIRDPKILLLDEATSSLDSESEKQISAALQKVAKGRTTVAVAHRLSTIQHADVIYVLGEGRVLEVGNHAELLRQKGMYFNMCQSQALDR
ncbi:hypothetical protein N0V93_001133 [Gnomoniopsis smithogilvyi]|uniref:ABC transporter n=1 Tax=Gnomoniopsis smithogilvyi TaxID=1191159 RepID=A0A9W8Z121_9PEZI|nr:hypothetical protein N0V93_001133 [Gnomoniopsis smithogilvyi]